MGLDSVLKEITREGEEKVEQIRKETEMEAEKILENAEREINEMLERARIEAEREAERIKRQEISSANLEVKRELLSKKKELLDQVFERLKEKVANLPPKERKDLLKKILKKHGKEGTRVYCSERDQKDVEKFSELEIAGNVDCIGGIIIESEDGNVRLNYTFDEILQQVYERNIKEVSERLFGK